MKVQVKKMPTSSITKKIENTNAYEEGNKRSEEYWSRTEKSLDKKEAEKIFLTKMKAAEEAIARGEYMTAEQAKKFLDI